jgi:hypothetical protein
MSIDSNRANSQFSTGPRTEQGKARSSQNAFKHGLTSQQLVVKPEEREAFEELHARYQAEIDPRGALQQELFDELVHAAWNLRRVRILQAGIDLLDPQFDRLQRHHTRFERTFHRTLKELRTLQTDARLHAMLSHHDRPRTPFLASPLVIAKRSQQRGLERTHDRGFTTPESPRSATPAAA